MNATNMAYTPEYQEQRKRWAAIFSSEYLSDTKTTELDEGYSAITRNYYGEVENCNLRASDTILLASSGEEIYRWRNLDNGGEFISVIRHSNGNIYLLFRIDLYGYGVYDLTNWKEFFYIPKERESFIWTGVNYNPVNDMLAVSGCIWGAPFSLYLLDFSNPMAETKWVDVIELLEGGYDKYDALDFIRWDRDILVVLATEWFDTGGKIETVQKELAISESQYIGS